MGLHCGYLVATSTQDDLIGELSRHTGELTAGSVFARTADAEPDYGNFELVAGELDGRAYLIDAPMMLSNNADLVVAMSGSLGTVIGCGAETVSGTYWLTVARDGGLLRHIWVSHAGTTRGMAIGEPLEHEEEHPLADVSGRGVFAAMEAFGLSPSAWFRSGPATIIEYDYTRPPPDGPIDQLQNEHYERYKRTDRAEVVIVTNAGEGS